MVRRREAHTNLGKKEYEMFSAATRDEGLTVKEAGRKALVETVSELDLRQDPLFQLKPARFREKVRVPGIDKRLYSSK